MLRARDLERHGPAVAAGAAVAAHASGLGGGYVWLDHAHIEEGLALAEPADWLSLLTREFAGTGFYRPLVALSLSLDAVISKTPAFFKVVTLGWHAAAVYMAVVAARALGSSERAALVAGVLFAVHPATSLVASAIAFRSEAMMTVFLLGLVVAHIRGRPFVAALCLAAGALTKETAWVLGPLFVAALELGRRMGREQRAPTRLLVAEGVALGATTVLHVAFASGLRATHAPLSFGLALGSRFAAVGKGALALLAPWNHAICDAFPVTGIAAPLSLLGVVVLGGVALLAWRSRTLAWLFALSILPALQIAPVMRWWSPHYFYLALALGSMLAVDAVDRRVPARMLLFAGLALPLAVMSLREGRRYASDTALWAPEVREEPACREGHFFLGEAAREQQDWGLAAEHYERAANAVPGYLAYADESAAFQNLGAARIAQERAEDARAAWTAALERTRDPEERRRVVHNLAVLALKTGNPAEAVRLLEPEMAAEHPLRESLFIRAKALHELGREQEARAIVEGLMRRHDE